MSLWGEGRRSRDDGRHTRSGGVSFCFEKSLATDAQGNGKLRPSGLRSRRRLPPWCESYRALLEEATVRV